MRTFRDIIAWQKAYQLTLRVYRHTQNFPKSEEFGLKSQIRRASVSIIANIAEGFKRSGTKDRIRFYNLAETSLEEVKCENLLGFDLGYYSSKEYAELSELENEAGRTLNGWMRSQK